MLHAEAYGHGTFVPGTRLAGRAPPTHTHSQPVAQYSLLPGSRINVQGPEEGVGEQQTRLPSQCLDP